MPLEGSALALQPLSPNGGGEASEARRLATLLEASQALAATGEPILVPRDPRDVSASFIGVPILLHRRTIGALTIELPYRPEREFERLVSFLEVVATMISQAVRVHHLLEAEREKLAPENAQTAEATGTVVTTSLGRAVEAFERGLLEDALKTTRGNRSKAARLLSTTERIVNYKVRKYRIDCKRFRG